MRLADVSSLLGGRQSGTFRALEESKGVGALPRDELCFSLILTSRRCLDVAAESQASAEEWQDLISQLLATAQRHAPPAGVRAARAVPRLPLPLPMPLPLPPASPPPAESPAGAALASAPSCDDVFASVERCDGPALERFFAGGCPVDLMHPISGDTAMICACRHGFTDVVELCLRRGARNDPHPDFGQTALQAAVSAGHTACADIILRAAARSAADAAIANQEDPNGEAPLHIACRCGNRECAALLLTHGADPNQVDGTGNGCLHCAAQGGHLQCLAFLIDHGCDDLLGAQNHQGESPLHVACRFGRSSCARLLIESAAELSTANAKGETAYAIAAALGHGDICRAIDAVDPSQAIAARQGLQMQRLPRPSALTQEIALPRPHLSLSPSASTQRTPGCRAAYGPHTFSEGATTHWSWGAPAPSSFPAPAVAENGHVTARHLSRMHRSGDWGSGAAGHGAAAGAAYCTTQSLPSARDWLRIARLTARESESAAQSPGSGRQSLAYGHETPRSAGGGGASAVPSHGGGTYRSGSGTAFPSTPAGDAANGDALPWQSCADPSLDADSAGAGGEDRLGDSFETSGRQWHRCYSEDGYEYFFCEATGESQWEDPRRGARAPVSSAPAARPRPAPPPAVATTTAPAAAASEAPTSGADGAALGSRAAATAGPQTVAPAEATATEDPAPAAEEAPAVAAPKDPRYEKFARMLKAGVPRQAVTNKLVADGLDPALLSDGAASGGTAAPPKADGAAPRSAFEREARYEKYRKMLKAGVPLPAVRNKMADDGLDPAAAHGPDRRPAKAAPAAEKKGGAEEDPRYARYRKMLKAGVPRAAVVNKIRSDGLDPSPFEEEEGGGDGGGGGGGGRGGGGSADSKKAAGRAKGGERRASVKLVSIHWEPVNDLPPERLRKSVWAQSDGGEDGIAQDEIEALQSLFGVDAAQKRSAGRARGAKGGAAAQAQARGAGAAALIDGRRANNVEIGLARFKAFSSYGALCECIIAQDRERLSVDNVSTLLSLLPTAAEEAALRQFRGSVQDLGRAERWFHAVAVGYRGVGAKLRCFRNACTFEEAADALRRDVEKLRASCVSVVENAAFAQMLKKLLAVGNILNEGTYRGNASSVSLESLLRVTTTKGADRKTTVLDYVVRLCLAKGEGAVLSFAAEFQAFAQEAARLSVPELEVQLRRLSDGVRAAEALVASPPPGETAPPHEVSFHAKATAFAAAGGGAVRELEAAMQAARGEALRLVEYFAEEPRLERVVVIFRTLHKFLVALRASVDKCTRQLKARQRQQAARDARPAKGVGQGP